jgi:hypothetical protein
MERAEFAGSGSASGSGSGGGARWAGGGLVARTTGRVFFALGGVDYACSGSTVAGARADVVVTAAHCVSDGADRWASDWTFVPGYDSGRAPYGSYPAVTFFVPGRWVSGANEDDDVAFVRVARPVADLAGAEPIAFGSRGSGPAYVFGYPARPPYTGRRLDYCTGKVTPDPYGGADAGMPCGMTEGDSGGPWLSRFDPATGSGVITGVTSFKYAGASHILYSANLGSVAQALYARAESAN